MSSSHRHRRIHSPELPLQLTIGVCTPPTEDRPSHWILMLAKRDAEYATWYHALGGPSLGQPWQVMIEKERLNSWVVNTRYKVAEIPAARRKAVRHSARKIPGKFCQQWVCDVIGDLESQNVAPEGTKSRMEALMEEDPYADATPQVEERRDEPSADRRRTGKPATSLKELWRGCFGT